jgi:hypothetical protein
VKRLAAVQSSYIPWKGYFDIVALADEFVLLDEVQYTRRDWRNRNRIKTADGLKWLTIPVQAKGNYHERIDQILVADGSWAGKHLKTLQHTYSRAPHFESYEEAIAALYDEAASLSRLSEINRTFLAGICPLLGIEARLSWSTEYATGGRKTARLVSLCRSAAATEYISGPAASNYLDQDMFREDGISVRYMDYSGYPEYPQQHPPFEHSVSVLDLLFHVGPEAPRFMKHVDSGTEQR